MGLDPEEVKTAINHMPEFEGKGLRNLTEPEATAIKSRWSFGFKASLLGTDNLPGPYVSIRLRREVHQVIKSRASALGMSLSRYLAERERLLGEPEA